MPTLGEVLAAARRESGGFAPWLAARDPELSGAVTEAAGTEGLPPTGYVRMAVADFARHASEEDWAHLASQMRTSEEPGLACLAIMVRWRLALGEAHAAHSHEGAHP